MNTSTIDNINKRKKPSVSETICLENEYYKKAGFYSDPITGEDEKWQTYLNLLALFGFEKWVKEKELDIAIESCQASVFTPEFAQVIDAVCNVQIEDFTVCLLTIDCFLDDIIYVPKEVIDFPKFAAHFYMFIEVAEEEGELIIRGMVNRNQLVKNINQFNLTINDEGMYEIPFQWFEEDAVNLLHYCGVLSPEAIALPQSITSLITSFTQTELRELLSNLQSKVENMWQNLSWKQKAIALEYPELFNLDVSKIPDNILESWENLSNYLSHKITNLSDWLNGNVGEDWYALEAILIPNKKRNWNRLRNLRSVRSITKKQAKPIYLTTLPDNQSLALIVEVKSIEDNQHNVKVKIQPREGDFLPVNLCLKVTLNPDTAEAESQEIFAREDDFWIQSEFEEKIGNRVTLKISYLDADFVEEIMV